MYSFAAHVLGAPAWVPDHAEDEIPGVAGIHDEVRVGLEEVVLKRCSGILAGGWACEAKDSVWDEADEDMNDGLPLMSKADGDARDIIRGCEVSRVGASVNGGNVGEAVGLVRADPFSGRRQRAAGEEVGAALCVLFSGGIWVGEVSKSFGNGFHLVGGHV